jgi:hypothetical protein
MMGRRVGRWIQPPPSRVDLSEDDAFFLRLVGDTWAWRERLVEELVFADATRVRVQSALQVNFPPDLLEEFVDSDMTQSANVLAPITTRPKRPLFNFGLTGPAGAPATLTSRASTSALQANYLTALAEEGMAAGDTTAIGGDLFEAIGLFTPALFRDYFFDRARKDFDLALSDYLTDGLGFTVPKIQVSSWRQLTGPAAAHLVAALQEPADDYSSSEEVLLAVPLMGTPPKSLGEITQIVDRYVGGVSAAHSKGDNAFLGVLAEYGRRYEIIVEVELPLLEPATIKLQEDRPLKVGRNLWVSHRFGLGDARSAHLEARIADPNVEIAGFDVRDLAGGEQALGPLESLRHTKESWSIYSSVPDRPFYVDISLRLRVVPQLRWTAVALSVMGIAAAAVALAIPREQSYVETLGILTIPVSVAAAFVLIREDTGLATRVQRMWRGALSLVTVALWTIVIACLIHYSGAQQDATGPLDSSASRESGEAPPPKVGSKDKEGGDGEERRKR